MTPRGIHFKKFFLLYGFALFSYENNLFKVRKILAPQNSHELYFATAQYLRVF